MVCASVALGVLTSCHDTPHPVDTQKVSSVPCAPSHALPTATEVFHLRNECARLGQKMLAAKEDSAEAGGSYSDWTYSFSGETHYNPETNRCYVEVDYVEYDKTRPSYEGFNRDLYDGQTGDLLAHTETVPAKDGIAEKHSAIVFVDHYRKGIPESDKLRGDAWIKADLEDEYRDTQQFISGLMADDRKQ